MVLRLPLLTAPLELTALLWDWDFKNLGLRAESTS